MRCLSVKLTLSLALLLSCACVAVAEIANPAETLPVLGARQVQLVESPEITLLDQEGAGKLYQAGPIQVLVMEGTPAEMGFQHGRLLAKKIHHLIREGYMPKALWGRGYSQEYVKTQSERMEKHFPPEIIEEMRGIVEGVKKAGVEDIAYEDIRLGVTQAEILHFPPDSPPSCSNFAVWGRWTTDGRLLHARNLDWNIKGDAQDDALVLVWRPKGGFPFMMIGWAGGVGSVSGMNARGITLGEMTLPSADATFDGLPLFLQMRLMLEKCDTLAKSVEFFEKCKRTTGWNFIIGDGGKRDGRALETDAKYCTEFTTMDPKETDATGHWGMAECVRRTNHPVGMDQLLRLSKAYGDKIGVTVETSEQLTLMAPLLKEQDSWQRYEWLSRAVEAQPGKIDAVGAVKILATGPVYCDATLHSFVFDPSAQTAWVAIAGNNPPVTATDMPFTKLVLTEWFK